MKPRKRLKLPRTVTIVLPLVTVVSVLGMAWLGWRLVVQEAIVDTQRAQQHVDEAADRIALGLRRTLTDARERLPGWGRRAPTDLPGDGVVLVMTSAGVTAAPAGRLLYWPYRAPVEAPAREFAEVETIEFAQGQPKLAAERYRRLAEREEPSVRAGALMRLARVERRLGHREQSVAAYRKLAEVASARIAGEPADLVARRALCDLGVGDVEALRRDLLAAHWELSRAQFDYYWGEVVRLRKIAEEPPADGVVLAALTARWWKEWRDDEPAPTEGIVWEGNQPLFAMARGDAERRVLLVLRPESLLRQEMARERVYCAAVTADGRLLAGRRDGVGRAAVRTAAEFQLPFTLHVMAPKGSEEELTGRRRFLGLGIALMLAFLVGGTYFTWRAVRKEMAVSQLQSDFVSAVSHEFRSPLTSMRQLSELLAEGRVASDERRQLYYQTLLGETDRLQRLVETLLVFGRMEAGARKYTFASVNADALVREVVAGFAHEVAHGARIEVSGPEGCSLWADRDSLAVALRNLIDNGLKYSPSEPVVWVEWAPEGAGVVLKVHDRGAGVARGEKDAIFEKFVRGSAAAACNAKGTGVGLAMVKQIAEAHGGHVSVDSVEGHGSTFSLWLKSDAPV